MYLIDTDLLLRAAVATADGHDLAVRWLDDRLAGRRHTAGLPWPALLDFLHSVTTPARLDPPADRATAWRQVQSWLDAPAAWIPAPGAQHPQLLADLLTTAPASTPLSTLHLAALAVEHGLTVATAGTGFHELPQVRRYSPIAFVGVGAPPGWR